jgi:membrane protein implicated in regulation of membrane protease activity
MDLLDTLQPHWLWLAIGLLLAIAEIAIPGVFLIWMAGAALVTGVIAWIDPELGLPALTVVFSVLAIAAVYLGRRYLLAHPVISADPLMNDRGARLIGENVVVTSAIEGGSGKVKQGDSEWLAKGPDAEPGTRMRVSGHDGTVLLVERLQ